MLQFFVFFCYSENYLQPLEQTINYRFPTVKTLVCGAMHLIWDDLIKLSQVFPNLEELRVPSNKITTLSTPASNNFKNLKILALEGNAIVEWSEVCKLSVLTNLQQLNLDNTRLSCIRFEKCNNQSLKMFESLKKIALSNNLINDVCILFNCK